MSERKPITSHLYFWVLVAIFTGVLLGHYYPGLAVKDSGPRPYARGTVTSYNGQPASYEVWGNDNSQAVAARFGLTQDELFYLNPQLRRGDTELLRDTHLNLSVAYR